MGERLASCENCLIRNVRFNDHFKYGLVTRRAFKDKDEEGISLTETRDKIKGYEDLTDYLTEASMYLPDITLGAAVMLSERAAQVLGFHWKSNPDPSRPVYGDLHVLGPTPEEMTSDMQDACAKLANLTGWSREPKPKID